MTCVIVEIVYNNSIHISLFQVSKDDMLPKKVCRPCRARLEDYHKFAERANRVQHTLGLLIQMKNTNVSAGPLVFGQHC